MRHARDYAQAIVDAQGDVARQREIFTACPQEWRALARELAKSAIDQAEQRSAQLVAHRSLMRNAAKRDPAPLVPTRSVFTLTKSSPEVGRARLAELRAALGQQESA
jgi:LmbE family N-acetylglucosaminyl deacetylase